MTSTMHLREGIQSSRFSWSIVAMIAFAAINAFALWYAAMTHPIEGLADSRLDIAIASLNWMTLLILALGVYRLTDIIVYEKVCEPFRMLFKDRVKGDHGIKTRRDATTGLKGFLASLINCNSCMGVWVAAGVVHFFIFMPRAAFIIMVIIALTGFERFFSKLYNFLERR